MRLICVSILLGIAACAAPAPQDGSGVETATVLDTSPPQTSFESMPEGPPEPPKAEEEKEQPTYHITANGVAGLPGSDGQTFAILDEYLAHLEIKGHTDRPFWELMKDGRYRWNTGRGMQFRETKYATREELLEKYGFSE